MTALASKINFPGSPVLHDFSNSSMLAFQNWSHLPFKSYFFHAHSDTALELDSLTFREHTLCSHCHISALCHLHPKCHHESAGDPPVFKAHFSNVTSVSNPVICSKVFFWFSCGFDYIQFYVYVSHVIGDNPVQDNLTGNKECGASRTLICIPFTALRMAPPTHSKCTGLF